jgi:hypothetical protein
VLRGNFARGHTLFVSAKEKRRESKDSPLHKHKKVAWFYGRGKLRRQTHGTRKTRHKTPGTAEEVS